MSQESLSKHLQLYKTLEARFDRVAKVYDATYGPPGEGTQGNPLVGWLREQFLDQLRRVLPASSSVIDIGSGTGEEALTLAREGYSVLGIDISPAMTRQAQTKAAVYGLQRHASFRTVAAGQIASLDERGPFQGAYASLGTLNTEPDLPGLARGLHDLLEPGAPLVVMVMSRHCAYEILYNLLRLRPGRTLKRAAEWQESRAGTGGVVAPVKFYEPDEFAALFDPYFTVESVSALPLWLPPVHLHELYRDRPRRYRRLLAWDQRMRTWQGFRAWGDHFMMILRHTAEHRGDTHD